LISNYQKKRWKKRLFWFCEGAALCVGAKPNVPFVRLAKIVFKKCGSAKKNKTRSVGLSRRNKVRCKVYMLSCRFDNLSVSLMVVVSSFRLACNVLALGEGGV
jgi:hypothetical protein